MDTPVPTGHLLRLAIFELDTKSGELRRHGLKISIRRSKPRL